MTDQQAIKIVYLVKANYVNFFRKYSEPETEAFTKLWINALRNHSFETAEAAVNAILSTSTEGYPPEIGKVVTWINRIEHPDEEELTALEAKDLVMRAARDLDPFEPEKKFNSLPPICQRLVGSPARLKEIAYEEDPAALLSWQARFQTSYAEAKQQEKDMRQLPASVRARIEANRTDRWTAPKIERKADPVIEEKPLTFSDMTENTKQKLDELKRRLTEAVTPKEEIA